MGEEKLIAAIATKPQAVSTDGKCPHAIDGPIRDSKNRCSCRSEYIVSLVCSDLSRRSKIIGDAGLTENRKYKPLLSKFEWDRACSGQHRPSKYPGIGGSSRLFPCAVSAG